MGGIDLINQWAESWMAFMGCRILDSVLVFAFAGLIWLLIRRRAAAQFGYCLFLLVLFKSVIPAPVSLPGLFQDFFLNQRVNENAGIQGAFGWTFGEMNTGDAAPSTASGVNNPAEELSNPSMRLTPQGSLLLLWAVIVLFLLLRLWWVEWKTRFMMSNTIPLNPESLSIDLNQLKQTARVKRRVQWVTGDWIKSPMTYGILYPVIAVPKEMAEHYTPNQIRWILLHELAHIRRGDMAVSLIQKILQAVFFFNPLVWWINAIVDKQREFACDDAALAGCESTRKECGEGFLGVVMQANSLPTFMPATLGMTGYEITIRRRLMRILDHNRILKARLSFSAEICLLALVLLVAPFSGRLALAQVGQWVKLSDSGPDTGSHGMIYDENRDQVVIFGGADSSGNNSNKFWIFDDSVWTELPSQRGLPNPTGNIGMTYDSLRDVIVINAGFYGAEGTWEWNREKWTKISVPGPSTRFAHTMVFDSKNGMCVLYGGTSIGLGSPYEQDTWGWDGTSWTLLAEDGPPARIYFDMVYDSARNRIVLYGGIQDGDYDKTFKDYGQPALSDTWEWDGTTWTQVALTGPNPGPRCYHAMAYDSERKKTILFGGGDKVYLPQFRIVSDMIWYTDVWEWDGVEWKQVESSGIEPPVRAAHRMVYDSKRNRIIMHGGIYKVITPFLYESDTNTWELSMTSGMSKGIWTLY